jgi:hypothetical protein
VLFFAVLFLAVLLPEAVFAVETFFAVEAFFAARFAGSFFDAVPFAPGPPRGALPDFAVEPPRRAAEETFRATFGALSAIALLIFGACLAT